jgi:hypothetical protein
MNSLPELVQTLTELRLQKREVESRLKLVEHEIHKRAEAMSLISAARRAARFVCLGKVVELSIGDFGTRNVTLYELASLPVVDEVASSH